jgi:hypothetical protein
VPPPACGNSKSGANTISAVELGLDVADLTADVSAGAEVASGATAVDGEEVVGCVVGAGSFAVSAGLLESLGRLLLPHAITSAVKSANANRPDRAIRLFRYPV